MIPVTVGSTVLYVLNETDAEAINRRRTDGASIAVRIQENKWPLGAQAHIGNTVRVGQVLPATVVQVFGIDGDDNPPINLQVILDGSDSYWATSRHRSESPENGFWFWPPRQQQPRDRFLPTNAA